MYVLNFGVIPRCERASPPTVGTFSPGRSTEISSIARPAFRYSTLRHGHGQGAHLWNGGMSFHRRRADRSAPARAAVLPPDSAVDVTAAGVIVHAGGPEPEPPAC